MDFEVLIVGSGLIGASLGLGLAKAGVKVALVEARAPQSNDTNDWDSRVYAIAPGSAAFLESCGAWTNLDQQRVCQVEEMRIFGDDVASKVGFSAYDAGLRELAFIVENRSLQRALSQALQLEPDVEIIAPATCRALTLTADAAHLELSDGRILRSHLIVGADGADSWVHAQAAIEVNTRHYDQLGVVANFQVTKPHHAIAYQWFTRDGVLALLPLPGDRVSMVWSTGNDHASQLLSLTPDALAAEVAATSLSVTGDLRLITPASAFPLRVQRVRNFVRPRLALVGDAAHNVHPLAGQGVNMGFRDARELTRVLAQRGPQNDCGDYYLLRRYQRARQEDIASMRVATDALQRLFSSERPWLARLRNFGLRVTDNQSYVKNLLVQRAVG